MARKELSDEVSSALESYRATQEMSGLFVSEPGPALNGEGPAPDHSLARVQLRLQAVELGVRASVLMLEHLCEERPLAPVSGALPQREMANNSDLLTTGQAASELGVSIATIRRRGNRGLIPVMRTVGGQRRFRLDDLAEAIRPQE